MEERRQQESQEFESRQKILNAALIEFSEKGKAGARMDSIAQAAGLNKAMIYYYFKNKDTLYRELLSFIVQQIMAMQRSIALREGPIEEVLEFAIGQIMETLSKEPCLFRLLYHDVLSGEMAFKDVVESISPGEAIPQKTGIAPRIGAAIATGQIRGEEPIHVAINIFGLTMFHVYFLPILKVIWNLPEIDEAAFNEARKKSILDLLHHGLFISPAEKSPDRRSQ